MSGLRKDDPVYYKKKITDLIRQAEKNGLVVMVDSNILSFRTETEFNGISTYEQASVEFAKVINS